jgi:hypothetical protein
VEYKKGAYNAKGRFLFSAGRPCILSVLITSDMAYPIMLESVSLTNLPPEWQSNSCMTLPEQSQMLQKNDIYAASFHMQAPTSVGIYAIGSVQLCFRRLDKKLPQPGEAAGTGHSGTFVVVHHLQHVSICSEVCCVTLRLPLCAGVGERFTACMRIETGEGSPHVLSGKAHISAGSGVKLESSADQEIVREEEACHELVWELIGQQSEIVKVSGHIEVAVGHERDALEDASAASGVSELQYSPSGKRHSLQLSGSVLVRDHS